MLTAAEIREAMDNDESFDGPTLLQGYAYAAAGRVRAVNVREDDDGITITSTVIGRRAYQARIEVWPDDDDDDEYFLESECTCRMAYDCKHVVATIAAFDQGLVAQLTPVPARRSPPWQQLLDQVLDDAPPLEGLEIPRVPVAVQVVVPKPSHHAGYNEASRPRLSLRPVRQGATKRWVQTGIGWRDLGHSGAGPSPSTAAVDRGDLDLLNELKIALISRRPQLMSGNDPIELHSASPSLWPILTRLAERGIPLVCSDPAVTVRSAPTDARIELDLARQDASNPDGPVLVRAGIACGDSWFPAEKSTFIGEPAHGVALWRGGPGQPGSTVLLARLALPPTPSLRQWLATGSAVRIDSSGLEELVGSYLPRLAERLPVRSADGTVEMPTETAVALHGLLRWHDDGSVDLNWSWQYRGSSRTRLYAVDLPPDGRDGRRRRAEAAILAGLDLPLDVAGLLGLAGESGGLTARRTLRDAAAMTFAREQLPVLRRQPDVEIEVVGEPPEFRELTGTPEVRFVPRGDAERKHRTDWLDLDVIVSVTDERLGVVTLDLPRVIQALAGEDTVIMVRPGTWIDVAGQPGLAKLARLVTEARALTDQPSGGLRLSRQAHGVLADLPEIGPTDGQLAEWSAASQSLREIVERGMPPEPAPLPGGLEATLRAYQHDGYQWLDFLRRHRLGGVLADDMGLGKTLQTLTMMLRDREVRTTDSDRRPFLVVAPSSVVGTWVGEASRFAPDLRVAAITESQARRSWPLSVAFDPDNGVDVVVTSYTLLRLEADCYLEQRWAGLILDEAQAVKNHRTKTHAALRDIEADCRFAITGTPIENNLMELWSILSLSSPGLFPHADAFRTSVAQPIQQNADPDALVALKRRIKPVMLRRTKELVAADLPAKTEQVVPVILSPRHRKLYDTHLQRERQRILQLLGDLDENRITILASLTKLRQLALDPALIGPEHERVGSAKIDELLERLTEVIAEGHRALVFSQFTSYLRRVRTRLTEAGIETTYLDGATRNRPAVIEGFRTGSAPVFLISLKAGGVGLTLTEADYCFLLDPWWNPAVENQAIDRTHRIGQTRPVMVYRLVSEGTIEEKVIELASRKAELYRSVLDADGLLSSGLTAADIAALLEH